MAEKLARSSLLSILTEPVRWMILPDRQAVRGIIWPPGLPQGFDQVGMNQGRGRKTGRASG
ncbi:MAG: hypothetical protein A3F83_13325 [Candidatus Glassbacteria bacterium RIFCSPLOWO2_12_FULL_58_11]|uniref:Uncharacterized protein n=1 Tax=Candidatus Glassbacteria bacterium RIFCSPLOWO2_12_FULL_58_11 TaxID=1817867 RepID=A0A1F5YU17_9BACT|nr:MAG: hypothetical protein A3F83_13325 [Candidatus Glassbacteria bacterium RIFCSPLOWO2_12_FULL_58_11]